MDYLRGVRLSLELYLGDEGTGKGAAGTAQEAVRYWSHRWREAGGVCSRVRTEEFILGLAPQEENIIYYQTNI